MLYDKKILTHSTNRVIEELDYISNHKNDRNPISIFDDAFTIIPGRAKAICTKLLENKIRLPLSCITRCDTVTEEILDLMKEAGFVSIGFSLESAVPRILRIIGKVHLPEDVPSGSLEKEIRFIDKLKTMSSYAKKIGMSPVFVSIMLGLPDETIEEAQRTMDVVSKLDIDYYIA